MSEPTLDQVYARLTQIGLPDLNANFDTLRLKELLAAFRAGSRLASDLAFTPGEASWDADAEEALGGVPCHRYHDAWTACSSGCGCWCGGEVGPRVPGDKGGLGCLADITHDWRGV